MSLSDLLSVSIVLEEVANQLSFLDKSNLSLTSKTLRNLIKTSPWAWNYVAAFEGETTASQYQALGKGLRSRGLQELGLRFVSTLILDDIPSFNQPVMDRVLELTSLKVLSLLRIRRFDYGALFEFVGTCLKERLSGQSLSKLEAIYLFGQPIVERSADLSGFAEKISPWYGPASVKHLIYIAEDDWTTWIRLMALSHSISFDHALCRGPICSSTNARIPVDRVLGHQGCCVCGSLPEGSLDLLVRPATRGLSNADQLRRTHPGADGNPLKVYARCLRCLNGRHCRGCWSFWCEQCYVIGLTGDQDIMDQDIRPFADEGATFCEPCSTRCSNCRFQAWKRCTLCGEVYCFEHIEYQIPVLFPVCTSCYLERY